MPSVDGHDLVGFCYSCGTDLGDPEDGGDRCGYKYAVWRDPVTGKLYAPHSLIYLGAEYDVEPDEVTP